MIIDVRKNILIVGLGLLGGSYCQALKKYGFHIAAITRSQSSIDYALENNLIDEGSIEIDERMIGEADLVVFALYPHIFVEWIEKNQKYLKSGCLITDVTGVKSSIVYKIQDMLRDDVEFIAAHPMAGREVYGVQNAKASIFKEANYIVVPTEKNTQDAIDTCKELGLLLGFERISELSPEKHDEMIAFVSQLTHCIAVALMTCNDEENIERFTGDSFRDLTRIARINDLMWSELFVENKEQLLKQMDLFMDKFIEMRDQLRNDDIDGLRQTMRYSSERRALFDKK
ncbi:MAG: prephenate dehydrogenase/arogenate dehydrogenase family protein [Erysipelotrichaceae bacterium]|nr:prephenate dehydrogenase/arogenate dehydrogenase family protein [Erysipelotrichaceae bacterium]